MRICLAIGLFFLGAFTAASGADDAATAPAAKVLVSQNQMNLYPLCLVSEKLGLAMFVNLRHPQSEPHAVCLIDLKTGKISDLSGSFDKPRENHLPQLLVSPDGRRCLVEIETDNAHLLYVQDLATRKASKLTVPSLGSRPFWCGATKIIFNERPQRGLPNRAKVIDVQNGKIADLPFYGRVLAVDMLGTTLAAMANRDDPTQPDTGMRPLVVMVLTDKGKILKTFPGLGERGVRAMSPRGQYVACLHGEDEDSDHSGKYTITALGKGASWEFDAMPTERIMKVSDAGEVITATEPALRTRTNTIRYRSASQREQVLGKLWDPIVSGNVLYYLGEKSQSIVSMPIPLATTDPEEAEFRKSPTFTPAPGAQSRPAAGSSGAMFGDFKGTAEEFLAAALKDPDVAIMNPPADKDPYGSLDAKEWMERASRTSATLSLYPDATPAEFNEQLPYRQRDAKWAGMGPGAVGYHRGWYPDGKVMFIEHFTEKGLVQARYYDAGGKLLSQIDDGSGLALLMQTKRRPGLVRGELRYANGQPVNADGRFDESKYQTATTRDSGSHDRRSIAMTWQGALGHAAYALRPARSRPTSSASSQSTSSASSRPTSAWNNEGIGTIWQEGQRAYGLQVKDGAMFFSDDGSATKRELKFDLGCKPGWVHIIADGSIYIWGNDTTAHPDKGIPNRIVFSRDLGKTWVKTSAPIDYMVSLDVQDDGTIVVGGRYLPDGGLREGEHWILLQPWNVMTTHGQRWTKLPSPFAGPSQVVKRIKVGDKGGMIYVVQEPSFRGSGSYAVLLCRSLDQMPIMAGESREEPEVILAEDGQSLQVLAKGKTISTTDIRTGNVIRNHRE